jgi:VanZ family protein
MGRMMASIFKRYRAGLRWLPAFLLAIAIFSFSATPGDEVQNTYKSFSTTIQAATTPTVAPAKPAAASVSPVIDWLKVGHVIGYFWLGIAALYGLSTRSRWSPGFALILCCLYSFTDEFHQIFTPGRSASPRDMLIDTLAALLGLALTLGVMASKNFFRQTL